jgi:hypothetical protein
VFPKEAEMNILYKSYFIDGIEFAEDDLKEMKENLKQSNKTCVNSGCSNPVRGKQKYCPGCKKIVQRERMRERRNKA